MSQTGIFHHEIKTKLANIAIMGVGVVLRIWPGQYPEPPTGTQYEFRVVLPVIETACPVKKTNCPAEIFSLSLQGETKMTDKLKILFVAAEVAPFSHVGVYPGNVLLPRNFLNLVTTSGFLPRNLD